MPARRSTPFAPWFLLAAGLAAAGLLVASPLARQGASMLWAAETAEAEPPATTADALPPPLTQYKGREIAQICGDADWLIRESRQREEDCRLLLKALHLKPGQVVCDLGCGNGFYTLQLAQRVGKTGTVYAVDIQQEMLHLLDRRAKKSQVLNVKPVLGTRLDPNLPKAELDLILAVDVYHEMSNPGEMLAALRLSLKPHGRLVLAEFRMEDPNVPIKLEHKMSKDQILKEVLPSGFRLAEQFDELPWQHLMIFEPAAE